MSVARKAILASMAGSIEEQQSQEMNSTLSANLPPEILSQIFLQVDPHTLYTSVRALSKGWKKCVEERLLASQFESGRWRVGLRVVRKPKMGNAWRGGRVGGNGVEAPGALWNEVYNRVSQRATQDGKTNEALINQARHAFALNVAARAGSLEDEMEPALSGHDDTFDHNTPIVHVIPMQFKRYESLSTTLQFNTPNEELHALFEREASRLDLDFGIVWRFPGDGQDDSQEWGDADPENGWLSRFYCSSFDTKRCENSEIEQSSVIKLRSTSLARRVRRAITRSDEEEGEIGEDEREDEDDSTSFSTLVNPSTPLEWSDRGHEYAALSLSLGTEFFVRRSARANYLLRRLEAEVEAAQKAKRQAKKKRNHVQSTRSSQASTPYLLRSPKLAVVDSAGSSSSSLLEVPALRLHQRLAAVSQSSIHSTNSSTPSARSLCSSGACTPTTSYTPAWKMDSRASYAAVASTPPSRPTSRRGSSGSPIGTRILRATVFGSPKQNVTPLPSVNASGYSSVQHRSLIDGKEAEMRAEQEQQKMEEDASGDLSTCSNEDDSSDFATSTKGYTSKVAISSHHSVPRCHFSAKLVRIGKNPRGAKEWQEGDVYGRNAMRQTVLPVQSSVAVWEWCR